MLIILVMNRSDDTLDINAFTATGNKRPERWTTSSTDDGSIVTLGISFNGDTDLQTFSTIMRKACLLQLVIIV